VKAELYRTKVEGDLDGDEAQYERDLPRRQRPACERQRGSQRSRRHDAAGAEAIHPSARPWRGEPGREQGHGQRAEDPFARPVEVLGHGGREHAEGVVERAVADDLGEAQGGNDQPAVE
jgi:hypothetical protein